MSVATLAFFGFAFAVAMLYNISGALSWRKSVLAIANLLFLLSFSLHGSAWIPYLGFLALGYGSIRIVGRFRGRPSFVALLLLQVLCFAWLKKYTFLPESSFLRFAFVTIGLSYVFFRVLHLFIDTWQGTLPGRLTVIDYFNYALNFTCLISGPIQRFEDYAAMQLTPVRPALTISLLGAAAERMVLGLFKISILGLLFFELHKRSLDALSSAGAESTVNRSLLAAAVLGIYPLFLYCNFSGYTDIVLGAAALYRLQLPPNFERPFSSTSFLEFWARWHMTLSNWLKTYVYMPLLKMMMTKLPAAVWQPYLGVFAFFVTFFLIGMWHGQTSAFAFYGVLLGLGVSANKFYQIVMAKRLGKQRFRALSAHPFYNTVCRGLTYTYFGLSLVWFWAGWMQIGTMCRSLGPLSLALGSLVVFTFSACALSLWEAIRVWLIALRVGDFPLLTSRYARTAYATAQFVVTVVLLEVISKPAPDIVYRAF